MKRIIIGLFGLLFISSCSTRKEIVYFQGAERLEGMESLLEFEPVFEINDVLHVRVSSMNEEVIKPFQMNTSSMSQGSSGGQQSTSLRGYMVDIDGNIQFPVLGQIEVAGKSRSELEEYLTREIRRYVTDAVIAVRLLNFRVVVLGETGGQTVVPVENERISVPELLASVGGINYTGKRDNILIIREVDGVKSIGRVDMTSTSVFTNPYYYLKQNDIVYVEPTTRQVKSAGWITSYQGIFSLITSSISLYFILTNL